MMEEAETDAASTVLIVDDEQPFVDALAVGLRREGFLVEVARDGASALAQFDSVSPDLVVLEVVLRSVSGIEVCREIRTRSRVPIVMVTSKGCEIDAIVGLEV